VHLGAALEAAPLDWGGLDALCVPTRANPAPLVVLLDRVTDPHNVGAILRSSEVFGACAVIAPRHHAAPETGALAKSASGALERQPYLRVRNLGDAMLELGAMGYVLIGLDGAAETALGPAIAAAAGQPIGLVLGAEGAGLRQRTRELCGALARISAASDFGSLNVSNAAAVALYAASKSARNTKIP
jgi:23S rRNA (guanosine2251-2'-O)-methyltransferase